jgi:hypothetical protein
MATVMMMGTKAMNKRLSAEEFDISVDAIARQHVELGRSLQLEDGYVAARLLGMKQPLSRNCCRGLHGEHLLLGLGLDED